MKLYYMTQDAIDELKGNFKHYAEFYKQNNKKESRNGSVLFMD